MRPHVTKERDTVLRACVVYEDVGMSSEARFFCKKHANSIFDIISVDEVFEEKFRKQTPRCVRDEGLSTKTDDVMKDISISYVCV